MAFLVKRLIVLLVTLLVVSFVTFLVPYLTPGDPARKILRARVSEVAQLDDDTVARLAADYGLDRPIPVQYWDWLSRAFTGDFGVSFTSRTSVFPIVVDAIGVTAVLAMTALGLALLISIPLGCLAAFRRGKWADHVITGVTQSFVAIPEYWIAPLLILLFSINLAVLPSAGWTGPASVVLPCIALALRPISYFTQVTRASMVDVLGSPYIVGSRARGLSMTATISKHGIRNALIPVVTLVSVWLAGLLGGSVVIEVIFGIPGMGRLTYSAVLNGDVPLMQASIISIVALTVIITSLTDVVYVFVNPTVRRSHVTA